MTARIAIVGASGWAGSRHVAAFAAEGATIAVLIDPSPLTADLAAEHGAAVLPSVDDLRLDDIDLVVVSLPTSMQPSVVGGLLERGFRVLEEKPMASTAADAAELADAPGVRERLMVGYTLHQHPAAGLLRTWLAGVTPVTVSARSVARKRSVESWRANPAEGGVVVVNGIHAIELVSSLFDAEPTVRAADASSGLYGSGVPEYVAATLEFEGGPLFRLETYWGPWDNTEGLNAGDWDLTVDVVAREGRFLWRNDSVSVWSRDGGEERTTFEPTDLFLEQARLALQFAAGLPPVIGFDAALRATRITDAIAAAQQVRA